MNILVVTLGVSWAVAPELLAYVNLNSFPLYAQHPGRATLREALRVQKVEPVEELWIVTTCDARTLDGVKQLRRWLEASAADVRLRVWYSQTVSELNDAAQCRHMRDLILRVVLHARQCCDSGQLVLSLAGGRKTMSADMQHAALLFGCHSLLHVTVAEPVPEALRAVDPDSFLKPLPASVAGALFPMIVGGYPPNRLLDVADGDVGGPVRPEDYPLPPAPEDGSPTPVAPEDVLESNLARRLQRAEHLLFNFTRRLTQGEPTNFQALYCLPPGLIEALRQTRLGIRPEKRAHELAWLQRLPKADLHCHLGGIASAAEMLEIACANAPALVDWKTHAGLQQWLNRLRPLVLAQDVTALRRALGSRATPDFKAIRYLFSDIPQPLVVAAFLMLFENHPALLDALIYGPLQQDAAFVGQGIACYEQLGDLQGSALLQSAASLAAACRIVLRQCRAHNIGYLELRCSPAKYTQGGLTEMAVIRILETELTCPDVQCALIFIASRHGPPSEMQRHVALARQLVHPDALRAIPLVGFDLAGNESIRSARDLRNMFMPLMEKCIHLTIHAGETEDVRSIWEALYHLNAERIGHGLKLAQQPDLLAHCLDRRVTLELCPSSNRQIVGFYENSETSRQEAATYPLGDYLRQGLRVTVNTDNPGISRTSLTHEYYRAACLTPGGLTQWELLQLVRNSFRSAFVTHQARKQLLLKAESEICAFLTRAL